MLKRLAKGLCLRVPLLRAMLLTRGTAWEVSPRHWFWQKVLGFNRDAYWPTHPSSKINGAHRIRIGKCSTPGVSPGCYLQGANGIEIGDYTILAPNVGLLSANHSVHDLRQTEPAPPIRIGAYCWLGMNAVVLPGVVLGDHTVVAAGAVVTKSFADGYCVIAGVPARELRVLDRAAVAEYRVEHEFLGYHEVRGRDVNDLYRELGVADV